MKLPYALRTMVGMGDNFCLTIPYALRAMVCGVWQSRSTIPDALRAMIWACVVNPVNSLPRSGCSTVEYAC